jgi:cytochrome c-type biogenesis protein
MSVAELKEEKGMFRKKAMLHTLFFLVGFSIVFVVIGLSSSFISSFFMAYQDLLRQAGAIFIVVFGLIVLGIFTPKFLMQDKKIHFRQRPAGYAGSVLIGIGFAAGWTPCTGPILGAVMGLAITNPGAGMFYMFFYVLGFAVPFFFLSFFLDKLTIIKKYNRVFLKGGGAIMVAMGVLLYFDWLTYLTSLLTNGLFGGFQGF